MHICIEGLDGTGKSTLVKAISKKFRQMGENVFQTSEPGSKAQEASMILRDLVLNNKYDKDIDDLSREYLLATSRRIQRKLSEKKIKNGDVVIQDRGWLSGLAYSQAKGFDIKEIEDINEQLNPNFKTMFDTIFFLENKDVEQSLSMAKSSKCEFKEGDTIESKGIQFQKDVKTNFNKLIEDHRGSVNIIPINIIRNGKRLSVEELVDIIIDKSKKTVIMLMGNSGTGKSTLEKKLIDYLPNIFSKVTSYTTRKIDKETRKEIQGVHYHFITKNEFKDMKENNKFIQRANYGGNEYGSTLNSYLTKSPYTLLTVTPKEGKKLSLELLKRGFKIKYVLFDISKDKIIENLKCDGLPKIEIQKRFERGDLKLEFNQENIKADFTVTDDMLNKMLINNFTAHLGIYG